MTDATGRVCIHCGKVISADRTWLCNNCGEPFADDPRKGAPVDPFRSGVPVIVRVYPGRTQSEAAEAFQSEAGRVAALGYMPVSQSWAEGRPGAGRVLALGLLANSIRPKGALTVTYTQTGAGASAPEGLTSQDTKLCPMCAEEVRSAAKICRFCRYEFPT